MRQDIRVSRKRNLRPKQIQVDEERSEENDRIVLQQGDVEHVGRKENASKSHADKLRSHKTDAQKFNKHEHPETTRGKSLVCAIAPGRVVVRPGVSAVVNFEVRNF